MNNSFLLLLLVASAALVGGALLHFIRNTNRPARERLVALSRVTDNNTVMPRQENLAAGVDLTLLTTRLGKAGFVTASQQRLVITLLVVLGALAIIIGSVFGGTQYGSIGALIGAAASGYLTLMAIVCFLNVRKRDLQREILYHMPLTLESVILLVESGLGVLPAIKKIVSQQSRGKQNPVLRFLRLVYDLAAHGMPFGQALALVADACEQRIVRHVFLHLDISGTEGGELIPSLRNLSGHAHTEWRLSVEHRVRRLENFVVFPVFASVIGLMFLTAAVPLVPVLRLSDALQGRTNLQSTMGSGLNGGDGTRNGK